MKIIQLTLLLLAIFFCGCHHRNGDLERALELSGANRSELEKVLEHYSKTADDELKLRAAIFLIENMPGHFTYHSPVLDQYREEVLNDPHLSSLDWDLLSFFLSYPYRLEETQGDWEIVEDITSVTAGFLINNIDRAFEAWRRPWTGHLDFDEFCEYILPYRLGHERLEYWRDSLDNKFADRSYWLSQIDEFHDSAYRACFHFNQDLMREFKELKTLIPRFESEAIRRSYDMDDWTCADFSFGAIFPMRAAGVPVARDFTPQWASRRNPHFWNMLLPEHKIAYTFLGYDELPHSRHKPSMKFPKAYRMTYGRNKSSLAGQNIDEPIPPVLSSPFFIDVTHEYVKTCDIEVRLIEQPSEPRKVAYICVFDNEQWFPVDWGYIKGGKVKFKNLNRNIMCMAGYWINNELVPASAPFQIDPLGQVRYIEPDGDDKAPLTLTRKYCSYVRYVWEAERMYGSVIEASNDIGFRDACVFDTIKDNTWGWYGSMDVNTDGLYRYVRIRPPADRKIMIAELEIFADGNPVKAQGSMVASQDEAPEDLAGGKINDGDLLTCMNINHWAGIDLGKPSMIDSVRYISWNDDNHVVPGHVYELFYCDGPHFRSLGRKRSDGYELLFDSIPRGGLYLLSDLTKGNQERIFTVDDGRVVFW